MKALLSVLALTLAGCATAPMIDYSTTDAGTVAAAVIVKGGKFDAVTTIEAPAMRERVLKQKSEVSVFDRYDSRMVLLRAIKAKGAPTIHQAYVEVEYSGDTWRFYDSARLAGGKALTIVPVERKVVRCGGVAGCEYRETIGVLLKEGDLQGSGDLEFALKTRSAGDDVITLPRSYIDGFLAAVNR